jgi:hypothetical protein
MADYTVDRDMQYPAATMAIRRLAKRLETNKALAKKVKRWERMLFVKGLVAQLSFTQKATARRSRNQIVLVRVLKSAPTVPVKGQYTPPDSSALNWGC